MPLSKEGQISTARRQRESDQEFLRRYGPEKFQEFLDSQGVYAYGFPDEVTHGKAVDLLYALNEECKWGNDAELRDKYTSNRFSYQFWRSSTPEPREVLTIEKPFPKGLYDQKLRAVGIPFREVLVYRLAELTDEQILNLRGGVLWNSDCYIDLNGTVKKP